MRSACADPTTATSGLLVGADGAPLVEAARQHQRAGVSRARIPAGGAAQSSVPPGPHRRRRRLAGARGACPRISVPSISAARPARFEESQLRALAEGDACSACRSPRSARGSGSPDSAAFVELVRHNVVLPADAAALGRRGARRVAAARRRGAACRRRGRACVLRGRRGGAGSIGAGSAGCSPRCSSRSTGRGGAELFMPLAGGAHRPDARPGARAALEAHARWRRRARRLESHARNP